MGAKRPVFLPNLAAYLVGLREARRWNQSQAADIAKRRGLEVGYQAFRWLEEGKIESPKPKLLKAVADLYDLPYEQLATMAARERYGLSTEGSDGSARILDLEQRLSANAATALRVRNAATELARVMTGDDEVEELLDLWMHFDENYRTGALKMMRAWREGAPVPGDAAVGTRAVPRRQSGVRGKRET